MVIQRVMLRDQVRDELVSMVRDGRISPGESVNEVQLSQMLGVSRTPLREALIMLESVGYVSSSDGKGFYFKPLNLQELQELSSILAALELLAVEQTPKEKMKKIAPELREMALAFTDDKVALNKLGVKDDEWHTKMVSACPNKALLNMLGRTRRLFHRYEAKLLGDEAMISRSADEHVKIADALIAYDLPLVKKALIENWAGGADRLMASYHAEKENS